MKGRVFQGLAGAAALAVGCGAQSWSPGPIQPSIWLGAAGDLLTLDSQGWVGLDEQQGLTVLPGVAGWITYPAAIPSRVFATAVSSGTRAFVFGGLDALGFTNSLWSFNRTVGDWVLRSNSGPSPRFGCAAATFVSGAAMLFFGGIDASGLRNDTWVLADLGVPIWVLQATPPGLSGRTGHAMSSGPNQSVVLFGGANQTAVFGDTWIYRGSAWAQFTGFGPPATSGARMIFDANRDITVLVHPNGQTWEWDDYRWRAVPATGGASWNGPALAMTLGFGGGVRAFQPTAAGLAEYTYTPSPADYLITFDATCSANGFSGLELVAHQRSLPILGQTLHLRATGVLPGSAFVGAYELSTLSQSPLGCGCSLLLTGVGYGVQFVPGTSTVRDWLLPIVANPALFGVAIDVQGFHVHAAAPCFVMSTQRGTLIPGW